MSEPLKLSHEITPPVGIVTCEGEVDMFTLPSLKEVIRRVLEEGCTHLVFDLSKVRYIDSSGASVLVGAVKMLLPVHGSVSLVGPNATLMRMLEMTRLKQFFRFHPTLPAALEALKGEGSPCGQKG